MRSEVTQASELLRSGDPKAVNEALRLLQGTVFSFSMKVCGHREDAEDTMQDVLLKAVPYLPKIESPKALAVWLYKVAQNRCWMSRRRSKFAPKEMIALDDLLPDASELESLTTAAHKDPEASLLSRENSERVRLAIQQIPPQYRIILVLHDMEELETSEVAQITGLREGTVRVRLHRARLLLRRELSQANNGRKPAKRAGNRRAAKPLQCRKMFAQLSEYLDGRVNDVTCDHIQRHLQDCPACFSFVQDLERAVDRCRKYEVLCKPETTEKLRLALVQEYVRILEGAKRPSVAKVAEALSLRQKTILRRSEN
jgi:RNA polymerase sigma-70 factor (ECF subfamily)